MVTLKANHKRAKEIVNQWPPWKKEVTLTRPTRPTRPKKKLYHNV